MQETEAEKDREREREKEREKERNRDGELGGGGRMEGGWVGEDGRRVGGGGRVFKGMHITANVDVRICTTYNI